MRDPAGSTKPNRHLVYCPTQNEEARMKDANTNQISKVAYAGSMTCLIALYGIVGGAALNYILN